MAYLMLGLVVAAVLWWLLATDRHTRSDDAAAAGASDGDDRCQVEAVLVAQRLSGLLSPLDYQRAMTELAIIDKDRDPVDLPPPDPVG